MGAEPDHFEYDQAFLDDLELIMRSHMRYWTSVCEDSCVPDFLAWQYKQRLYLLDQMLNDIYKECHETLIRIKTYDSEDSWLAEQATERAFQRLKGK